MSTYRSLIDPDYLEKNTTDDDSPSLTDYLIEARRKKAEALYFAEIRRNIFIAVTVVDPNATIPDRYEVEKFRGKMLKVYDKKSAQKIDLTTEIEDSWVQRLFVQRPDLFEKGRVVVTKYLTHWAGWPDEDDTWINGCEAPACLRKEFDDSVGVIQDAENMVCEKDLARFPGVSEQE